MSETANATPGGFVARVSRWSGINRGLILFSIAILAVACSQDPAGSTADFSISLAPATLTLTQAANGTATVTISRTDFTDAVTLSLSGAPTGVTGSFSPAAPTGTASTLTINVAGTVTPGTYNMTVNGSGTPGNRSTALTLIVNTAGGSGDVTVDFSHCTAGDPAPLWLAYQEGSGPWTPVSGAGNVYAFAIDSSRGGLAFVQLRPGAQTEVRVHYLTRAEFTASPLTICVPDDVVGHTITGTAAGLDMTETAYISLGGGGAVSVNGTGSLGFTLANVGDGTHDLMGYKTDQLTPGADTALLRRDVVVSGDGSVGTVDFRGSEAFAAAKATITVAGLSGGETLSHQIQYFLRTTCELAALGPGGLAGVTFTASGIPSAKQRPSDYHQLVVFAVRSNDSRTMGESFHTLAARTLTLGGSLSTPTVTSLGGPYKRLQAAYTLPADNDFSTVFYYGDAASSKSVSITASTKYLGVASVSLGLADYSGLAGWDNNWAPTASSTGNWWVYGDGGNFLTSSTLRPGESGWRSPCGENTRFTSTGAWGTF